MGGPEATTQTDTLHIGIVTDEQWPELTDSDRLLAEALEGRGHSVTPVIWTDPSVDYDTLDLLVVRSCYEYHTRPEAFRAWLEKREIMGPPVVNPVPVIRWNMHKFYLRELDAAGVEVLETAFIEAATERALDGILEDHGWDDAVVKPAIGTSSAGAWRTSQSRAQEDQDRFEGVLAEGDHLVQRYAPEIADGERSLVFIGGAFSHAWRSIPAEGEFRSQSTYGGETVPFEPSQTLVDQAREILETGRQHIGVGDGIAYARVDGVERGGRFVLMELELVEPYLGLGRDEAAPERLADAVLSAGTLDGG